MMNTLTSVALTFTLAAAFSTAVQQDCREFPNYNTGLYTYIVCLGAPQVTDLDTTQTFCQQEFNSEVIEFRSEQEYNFIMSELGNGTISEGFSFITGFLQRKSDKNRFKPQTGEFYWLSEPNVIITSNSTTYWEPFRRLVEEFSGLALNTQYSKSFVVDLKGAWFPGSSFSGAAPSATVYTPGNLICMRRGVPQIEQPTNKNTSETDSLRKEAPFQYWIVIAVAVGVVLIGLILGLVIFVVHKKSSRKQEQKFHKVPQADNHAPQQV